MCELSGYLLGGDLATAYTKADTDLISYPFLLASFDIQLWLSSEMSVLDDDLFQSCVGNRSMLIIASLYLSTFLAHIFQRHKQLNQQSIKIQIVARFFITSLMIHQIETQTMHLSHTQPIFLTRCSPVYIDSIFFWSLSLVIGIVTT